MIIEIVKSNTFQYILIITHWQRPLRIRYAYVDGPCSDMCVRIVAFNCCTLTRFGIHLRLDLNPIAILLITCTLTIKYCNNTYICKIRASNTMYSLINATSFYCDKFYFMRSPSLYIKTNLHLEVWNKRLTIPNSFILKILNLLFIVKTTYIIMESILQPNKISCLFFKYFFFQ